MSNNIQKSCSTSWFFWFVLNKMTIHNISKHEWRNEKIECNGSLKTDVDINYQHFIIFWFQTVLNGILMVCFTTRSFAKKILSTMYHRRRRRIEKKINWLFCNTVLENHKNDSLLQDNIFFIIKCRTLKVIQKIRFCPFAQLFLNNFDHLERPFCSISDTVNIQPINSYAAKTWWWQVFSEMNNFFIMAIYLVFEE